MRDCRCFRCADWRSISYPQDGYTDHSQFHFILALRSFFLGLRTRLFKFGIRPLVDVSFFWWAIQTPCQLQRMAVKLYHDLAMLLSQYGISQNGRLQNRGHVEAVICGLLPKARLGLPPGNNESITRNPVTRSRQ
jgi:hypothetical protein